MKLLAKTLFAALVAVPFVWANAALDGPLLLTTGVVVAALLSAHTAVWTLMPAFALLAVHDASVGLAAAFVLTVVLLAGVGWVYTEPGAAGKLGAVTFGVAFALLMLEIGARIVDTEAPAIAAPPTPPPTNNPPPENIPDGPPVAGTGYIEWLEPGTDAPWAHLTGFGPRLNATARAYMVDAEGEIVYDVQPTYNSFGGRGPEFPYDKPDDEVRALIIGDSFVESVQYEYRYTFPALLDDLLDDERTPDGKVVEILSIGRTGWGTLQQLIYYQNEGYRFDADVVVLMMYINDVADNYPSFFYPGRNNEQFEFVFVDDTVRLVDRGSGAPLPPDAALTLYEALPGPAQNLALPRLLLSAFDRPQEVLTPGGALTTMHPQFGIYVTEPEPEGYAKGWDRTARALELFAEAVQANGARLLVVPISHGEGMAENVANWFPRQTQGWAWQGDLPEQRIAAIVEGTSADLLLTLGPFEEVAAGMGKPVYSALFLREDGHFNGVGHTAMAQVLYDRFVAEGYVATE